MRVYWEKGREFGGQLLEPAVETDLAGWKMGLEFGKQFLGELV